MKKLRIAQAALLAAALVALPATAFAASNSTFNQTVNTGTLATDIMNASRVSVGSPSIAMSAKSFSFDCQAGGSASTGTFGTNTERIYVSNGDAADNGWTLTAAATSGATARWANGGASRFIDFNDPTGSTAGCTDGGDADTTAGQLTLDPNAGTLTADCGSCATTNVTKGSATGFNQGTTDSVTLLNAAASSDDIWRGYLTSVGVSQTVPVEALPPA